MPFALATFRAPERTCQRCATTPKQARSASKQCARHYALYRAQRPVNAMKQAYFAGFRASHAQCKMHIKLCKKQIINYNINIRYFFVFAMLFESEIAMKRMLQPSFSSVSADGQAMYLITRMLRKRYLTYVSSVMPDAQGRLQEGTFSFCYRRKQRRKGEMMAEKTTETADKRERNTAASIFKTLYAVDVSGRLEKKPSSDKRGPELSYLSWAWAWAEIKKLYPSASYRIIEFDERGVETEHGYPFQVIGSAGYMVWTELTLEGQTYRMWLPVMDSHNASVRKDEYTVQTRFSSYKVPPFSTTLLNKTIMRCLVKNMAMFGLGLTIYAGEDTPDLTMPQDAEPQQDAPAQQNMPAPPEPSDVPPAEPEEFEENPEPEPDPPVDPIALQQAMAMQVQIDNKAYQLGDFVTKSRDKAKSQGTLARCAADVHFAPEVRNAATLILKGINSGQVAYPARAVQQ